MALLCLPASLAAGADKPVDPCRLLSPATLETVQGSRPTALVPSARKDAILQSRSCFYSLSPSSQSVNLEVLTAAGSTDIRQFWKQRFHARAEEENTDRDDPPGRRERAGGEANEHRAPPQPVPGVGEEAFWVYSGRDGAIYALQRGYILRLSVGGKANEADQRKRATELALSALGELMRP